MDYYRLNELPETYKKCKAYTEKFETWLINVANSRGLEVAAAQAQAAAQEADSKRRGRKGRASKPPKILTKDMLPLVEALAESEPHEDISGLNDLNDAIRTRKEVTNYYRVRNQGDEGHSFFINMLGNVRDTLNAWLLPIRAIVVEHDIEDEVRNMNSHGSHDGLVFNVVDGDEGHGEARPGDREDEEAQPKTPRASMATQPSRKAMKSKGSSAPLLSEEELELEREFEVLCFLYDFNHLRIVIRQVWSDWKNQKIGTITAALVTDLALGVVGQNVLALVEDLEDNPRERKLDRIVLKLWHTLVIDESENLPSSENPTREFKILKAIFCVEGLEYMREYRRLQKEGTWQFDIELVKNYPLMYTLFDFDLVRSKSLRLPILDKFTESMCSPDAQSTLWLGYGFQMLLDVNLIVLKDHPVIFAEHLDQAMHTVDLIRAHIDYEDTMWDAGTRPDYMTVGDTKVSNVFFPTLHSLAAWLKQFTDEDADIASGTGSGTGSASERKRTTIERNEDFLTCHPVLAGLVSYHFHKSYFGIAIQKTQWFLVALAHLYNACCQVGGLNMAWPDLQFVIDSQGEKRIFVGTKPRNPQFFYNRLALAMCASSRIFGTDHTRSGLWTKTPREMRAKRGLLSYFPLEDKIRQYYARGADDRRWIKLHNLFAYLKKEVDAEAHCAQPLAPVATRIDELRDVFAAGASKMAPRKPKKRRKRKSAHHAVAPEAFNTESVHAPLLMKAEKVLKRNELHAHFDYLSFFRRAFAFVASIRSEMMWDGSMDIGHTAENPEAESNFSRLAHLFLELKIKPQNANVEVKGDEVSKDVVALDKLRKIAKLMEGFIEEQGLAELVDAQVRRRHPCDPGNYDSAMHEKEAGVKEEDNSPTPIYHVLTIPPGKVLRKREFNKLGRLVLRVLGLVPKMGFHHSSRIRRHKVRFFCYGKCRLFKTIFSYTGSWVPPPMVSNPEWIGEEAVEDDGWETASENGNATAGRDFDSSAN